MDSQTIIEIIMIGILLLCGYLFIMRYMKKNISIRTSTPLLGGIILFFYGIICAVLIFILKSAGDMNYTFLSILMLSSFLTVLGMLAYLFRHFSDMNKGMVVLFAVYLLSVGYITIFSRNNNAHDTSVMVGFSSIQEVMDTGSLQPLKHMFLNVAMFVPIGFLIPMMRHGHLNKLLLVAPLCALLSVSIEATQLILQLGQCDIEDIAANTLGGVIGLLVYWLCARLFRWNEEDEDEYEDE